MTEKKYLYQRKERTTTLVLSFLFGKKIIVSLSLLSGFFLRLPEALPEPRRGKMMMVAWHRKQRTVRGNETQKKSIHPRSTHSRAHNLACRAFSPTQGNMLPFLEARMMMQVFEKKWEICSFWASKLCLEA